MKKIFFLAVFCLLASASPVKIFGDETANGAGGHITFGDSAYVAIGEKGATFAVYPSCF